MEIKGCGPAVVIVEIEKQFENYFNGIFLVSSRELLGRDDVETTVPKRIYGKVLAAPTRYLGLSEPIIYTSEDIDDAPRQPPNEKYTGNGNQHPSFREWGIHNLVTIVPVQGTQGKVFYENTIQDWLKPNDTVWFHGTSTEKIHLIAKNTYAIPVSQILAYKRDNGGFTPFAGRVFLKPVRNQYYTSNVVIPEWVRDVPQPFVGEVIYIGKPLRGSNVHPLIETGDYVEFPKVRKWDVTIEGKDLIVVDAEHITKIYKKDARQLIAS